MILRKNRRGLTSVVTLIILVGSLAMGSGLVGYSSSIFKNDAHQTRLFIQDIKVWSYTNAPNDITWGVVGVRNIGDNAVSLDKIQIRGNSLPFANWYVEKNQTAVTTANIQSQYKTPSIDNTGMMQSDTSLSSNSQCANITTNIKIDFDGATGTNPMLCLQQNNGPVALNPSEKIIVYFRVPNGMISNLDIGASTTITVSAQNTVAIIPTPIRSADQLSTNSNVFFNFLVRTQGIPDSQLAALYGKHSHQSDIITQFSNHTLSSTITSQVAGQKSVSYFSLADLQANAGNLHNLGYTWIAYDLEGSYSPANEVANPVSSIQQASQIAHSNGLKLLISPAGISQNSYSAMAQYADGWVLQAMNLIAGDPTVMSNTVHSIVSTIKSGNPNEIVILQVSVNLNTVDQMNNAWDLTKDVVNGITIFYSNAAQISDMSQVLTHVDGIS